MGDTKIFAIARLVLRFRPRKGGGARTIEHTHRAPPLWFLSAAEAVETVRKESGRSALRRCGATSDVLHAAISTRALHPSSAAVLLPAARYALPLPGARPDPRSQCSSE